jgi:hypothetical protein
MRDAPRAPAEGSPSTRGVAAAAVREVQPWFHGDAKVVLRDGSVLTWSRRFRAKAEGIF